MKTVLPILCSMLLGLHLWGQQTGTVDYPNLGISFTIPDGWVGQESQGGFMIGHYTIPGLILLAPHEIRTLEEMKKEAAAGMNDGVSIDLQLSGQIRSVGDQAISADYQGSIQGQPAHARAIGVINPQGTGVNIIAMSTTAEFSDALSNAAMDVYKSLVLKKAETGDMIRQWKDFLSNTRLTFMESYTSSPSYDGAIGGGYSNTTRMDLCGEGFFKYYSEGSVGLGGDGISASSGGTSKGQGSWSVESEYGEAILMLRFHDGNVKSFTLSYTDDKLYLNGNRYFRTTEGEYAPQCY